jgi:hypothetical protein
MLQLSSADAATKAIQDLVHALKNPHPTSPFVTLGDGQRNALNQLTLIFTASLPHQRNKNGTTTKISEPSNSVRDKLVTLQNQTNASRIPPNSNELEASAPAPRMIPPLPRVDSPVTRRTSNRYTGSPCCRPTPTHCYPTGSHTSPNASLPRANHVATVTGPIFQLPTAVLLHVAHSVLNPLTGQSLEYRQLFQGPTKDKWIYGFANKLGRLAQGAGTCMPTGMETIHFIPRGKVPADCKVTYGRIIAMIRPQKSESTASASLSVATSSTILAMLASPPPT